MSLRPNSPSAAPHSAESHPLDLVRSLVTGLVPSSDPTAVFGSVTRLCVPRFSDGCAIKLVEPGRPVYRVAHRRDEPNGTFAQAQVGENESCSRVTTFFRSPADEQGSVYHGLMIHTWDVENPPDSLTSARIEAARRLADGAMEAVSAQRAAEQHLPPSDPPAALREALWDARQIGYAVGMLIAKHGLSDDEAMAVLRLAGDRTNRTVLHVAEEFLQTGRLSEL